MDAGVIAAIVIAAIVLIALLVILGRKGRERQHETKRAEALEVHREAEILDARAQRRQAEADRAAAEAREKSAAAEREREQAQERQERATELHPDEEPDFRSEAGHGVRPGGHFVRQAERDQSTRR